MKAGGAVTEHRPPVSRVQQNRRQAIRVANF
jgi:hypothetical protein